MKRLYALWLTLLTLLLIPAGGAWGQLQNYYFVHTSGDPTAMDGSTILFQSGTGFAGSRAFNSKWTINVGFNFKFAGNLYSTLTLSTNGIIYFGSQFPSDQTNNFTGLNIPFVAPFWDQLRFGGGTNSPIPQNNPGQHCTQPRFHYIVKGTSPNRVLTVEYKQISIAHNGGGGWGSNAPGTFQVRFYEVDGRIEFWYGSMTNCDACGRASGRCDPVSASIGISANSSSFISISFPAGVPTENRVTPNNNVSIDPNTGTPIAPNTILAFGECVTVLNGRIGQDNGGTAALNNGDTFFNGFEVQMGESAIYRPFDIRMISAICQGPYTLTISGPAAADYYFGTPGTQSITRTLPVGGTSEIPEITFRPSATGLRSATLTVTGVGITRTFNLAASAPFVNYTGHVAQGGTARMKTGDVLLQGIRVRRLTSATFSPFTLTNMSTVNRAISYTIIGGNGQYSIAPTATLAPGQTLTPTITFNPTGFGVQKATLEVNAGGQIRTFPLEAISTAPGASFVTVSNSMTIDSSSTLFANTYACVGNEVQALEVEVENIGYEPFTISGVVFYETDTLIQQGIPRYAFRRDAQGNLIESKDYVVTLTRPTLPYKPGPSIFPVTLTENQKMTFYVSFIGNLPGKRYARGFFYTNGENFASRSIQGVVTDGILSFDVFGRGNGARLAGSLNGTLPRAVIFPGTRLGSSSEATLRLANPGVCSLRISIPKLGLTSGDVEEFSIIRMPVGFIDPVTQDLVLAPGQTADMTLGFKPIQAGSRRASLRLVTNDSTIHIPNITERGVYYIDLYGGGATDLYAQGIDFGQALIGGDATEQKKGIVRVVNTMSTPLTINTIEIRGTDAAEFVEDPALPWPDSKLLNSGEELELHVIFAPAAGGDPGDRNAEVKITTSLGAEASAPLKGIAGTRTMGIDPPSIAFVGTTSGRFQRRMITITNTGTMTMQLNEPEITGPDAANFQLGTLARTELAPGANEFLELTYAPVAPGVFNATLVFTGNATNSPQQILLNGTAFMPKGPDGNDLSNPVTGIEDGVGSSVDYNSVSGVETETSAAGVTLYQSTPNPANEAVEIRYNLVSGTNVELELYDAQGRVVRVIESGARTAGERSVRVDVRGLANGTYIYRLKANGQTLSRTMTISR